MSRAIAELIVFIVAFTLVFVAVGMIFGGQWVILALPLGVLGGGALAEWQERRGVS
jgi:hypothetical protein